jgi:hypothetical protein
VNTLKAVFLVSAKIMAVVVVEIVDRTINKFDRQHRHAPSPMPQNKSSLPRGFRRFDGGAALLARSDAFGASAAVSRSPEPHAGPRDSAVKEGTGARGQTERCNIL